MAIKPAVPFGLFKHTIYSCLAVAAIRIRALLLFSGIC